MKTNNEDFRLWSGTVMGAGFDERLDAALAGSFSSVSMFPIDYKNACESGLSDEDMRKRIAASGVRVAVIDPLTKWLPGWEPPEAMSGEDLAFADFEVEEVLDIADALGAESISVIEFFGKEVPADVGAESFAAICDRAAERGLRVHLEFQPYSGIPDLAAAWEIVSRADRPNGGLVLDSWHYFRGVPDDELLRSIPPEKVFVLQISDAAAEQQGSLLNDGMHHRLLPEQGSFDLRSLLRALDDTGARPSVGAEIFSDDLGTLPPEEAGKRAGESLRALLDTVRRTTSDSH